jgi:hypothetical protein
MDLHKTNTRWLMHSWNTFGTRTNHGQPKATSDSQDSPWPELGGSHHLPLYSILYASPRGSHPNRFLSRDSQMGVPEFLNSRLSQFWGFITFFTDLRLRWGLNQSCSPRWELSNNMSHATYTQGNLVDSRLLVVGNQTASLTLGWRFRSGVHHDSNSQSGSSLGSVKVHSLTLFCTPRSIKCDSRASLLARTFASPCLGHKSKARVATTCHFS